MDRVRRVWRDCRAGRYEAGYQWGTRSASGRRAIRARRRWAGCWPTPGGELSALRAQIAAYPEPLRAGYRAEKERRHGL